MRLSRPQIPFISNVTGSWMSDQDATDPGYWARHVRSTVRFNDSLQEALKKPNSVLLEVGPGKVLSELARRIYPETTTLASMAGAPCGAAWRKPLADCGVKVLPLIGSSITRQKIGDEFPAHISF